MIVGGCLCGGVRYRYVGDIREISMCHCSRCRKAQGSAFAAVCPIETARFEIITGQELLKEYRDRPGKARVFCSRCGSPIYSARDARPLERRLRLGTVETPFTCENAYHIFVGSKASWYAIADDLPRHDQAKS